MKFLFLGLAILIQPMTTFADFPGPILIKVTAAGYVMVGQRYQTRCEVYFDHVTLTRHAEGLGAVELRKIQLQGNAQLTIAEAAKGPIIVQPAPADGPMEVYQAALQRPDQIVTVDLGSYTGGDGKRTINTSVAAQGLRKFLDMICQ